MKNLSYVLAIFLLACGINEAQVIPMIPSHTILGNSTGSIAAPVAITALPSGVTTTGGQTPVGTNCTTGCAAGQVAVLTSSTGNVVGGTGTLNSSGFGINGAYAGGSALNGSNSVITGTISGTVLTVSSIISGVVTPGSGVTGTNITSGTIIASNGTGSGGTGTYNLNISSTVGSAETITLTGGAPTTACTNNCDVLIGYGAGSSLLSADPLTTAVGYKACGSMAVSNSESTCVGWSAGANISNGPSHVTLLGINTAGACTTLCGGLAALGTDAFRNSVVAFYSNGIGDSASINGSYYSSNADGYGAMDGTATSSFQSSDCQGYQCMHAGGTGQLNVNDACQGYVCLQNTAGAQFAQCQGSKCFSAVTNGYFLSGMGYNVGPSVTTAHDVLLWGTLSCDDASNANDYFAICGSNGAFVTGTGINAPGSGLITWLAPVVVGGTAFTVSGCGTAGSVTGTGTSGTFTVGTGASTCTFTFVINGSTAMNAPHGWIANVDDVTAKIHCPNNGAMGAVGTATVICNSTVTTGDLIAFSALPY